MNLVATMQGANVLAEHLYVMGAIFQPSMMALTHYFGALMAEFAKANHFKNIDTQATYDSIKSSGAYPVGSGAAVDMFVGTPQARFLEFGFVHHHTGNWIHNPFMIPAADAVAPMLVDAVNQFAEVVGSRRFYTGAAAATGAGDVLGSVRGLLYSYSKFAGDLQVLGFSGLSKSRGYAVRGAKGIGNLQAIETGRLGSRITRLVSGRVGGSIIRGGNFQVGSGASGRIYNRISGRAFGGSLSQIRIGF